MSGFLGVLAFSFSLPATRLAVEDLDPTFVGLGRALVAAALAAPARRSDESGSPRGATCRGSRSSASAS